MFQEMSNFSKPITPWCHPGLTMICNRLTLNHFCGTFIKIAHCFFFSKKSLASFISPATLNSSSILIPLTPSIIGRVIFLQCIIGKVIFWLSPLQINSLTSCQFYAQISGPPVHQHRVNHHALYHGFYQLCSTHHSQVFTFLARKLRTHLVYNFVEIARLGCTIKIGPPR